MVVEAVESGATGPSVTFPSPQIVIAVIAGLMVTSLLFEFLTNSLFRFLKRRKISKRLLLSAYKELMILGFISFFAFLSQNVFFSASIPADFMMFVELVHFELAITGLLYMITIVLMLFANIYYGKVFSQFEREMTVATGMLIPNEGSIFQRLWKVFDANEYYNIRRVFIRQYKLLKDEFDYSDFLKAGMNNVIIQILPLDWKVWLLILADVVIIVVSDRFIKNKFSGLQLGAIVYIASTWIVFLFACIATYKCKSILRIVVSDSRQKKLLKNRLSTTIPHGGGSSGGGSISPTSSTIVNHTEPWGNTSSNISSPINVRRLDDPTRLPGDNSLKEYSSSYSSFTSFASLNQFGSPTELNTSSTQLGDDYSSSTVLSASPSRLSPTTLSPKISRLRSRESSADESDVKELLGKRRERTREEEPPLPFMPIATNGSYHSFPVADEETDFVFPQRNQEEASFFRHVWRWFGWYQLYLDVTDQERLFWFSNASMLLKIIQVLVLSQVVSLAVLCRMASTWWVNVSPAVVFCAAIAGPATLFIFLRYLLPLYSLTGYSLPTVPSRNLMKRYVKKIRTGPFSFDSSSSPPSTTATTVVIN